MTCAHEDHRHHIEKDGKVWHWICSMCGERSPVPTRDPHCEAQRAADIAAERADSYRPNWWPLVGVACTIACLGIFALVCYVGYHICGGGWR